MPTTPRVALVVPNLEDGGGVPSVARFLLSTALAADWDVSLISLAMSSKDDVSLKILGPSSWRAGLGTRVGTWEGTPFTHVGCRIAEFETRRYAPRAEIAVLVESSDLIQVVAGSPAWALPALDLGRPVSLHVATRVKEERRRRDTAGLGPRGAWRRRMTAATTALEGRALGGVDAVQVMNPWMLDVARAHVRHGRPSDVRLAAPGVDVDAFFPATFDNDRPRHVLSVGRFDDPRKNVTLLLDAFASIADRVPGVSLVTAGATRPPATFDAAVVRAGLVGRVRHVDRPTRNELVKLYQGAEAFALASDEEGFGVVLLEAMACGVPVVSTRSGGPEGFVTDGHDGFLVERDDPDQLGARLLSLLSDRALRDEMGTRARHTIEGRYANNIAGAQFVEVWEQLLGRSR